MRSADHSRTPSSRHQDPGSATPSHPSRTVAPPSPPSFLRRQESRSTQAHAERRPQPYPQFPSPGSGVRHTVTPEPHRGASLSPVIHAQAGITKQPSSCGAPTTAVPPVPVTRIRGPPLRHTRAAPWRLPLPRHSCEGRNHEAAKLMRSADHSRTPSSRHQDPESVTPSHPSRTVAPPSPPSFLRRQEPRSTQAHAERRPQPYPQFPSPGS